MKFIDTMRTKEFFGKTPKGEEVNIFKISNKNGMEVKILNYGATVVSIKVADAQGDFDDVVLGYDKIEDYIKNNSYFGAIIGRHANRIENSNFEINGVIYNVTKNFGEHQLHGGKNGFDKVIWEVKSGKDIMGESLEFYYMSKDGEEGFPGNLECRVTYTVTEENSLKINYCAVSDKDTVVNLTNHSYFNLSGHGSGNILKHQVMIDADEFTENDENGIPTGKLLKVNGTPMDFTKLTPVENGIVSDYYQIKIGNGYDHNWVVNTQIGKIKKVAESYEPTKGRVLEVYTTMPGMQFYTGNFIRRTEGCKDGAKYHPLSGLCFETQYFPNSLKHKNFPSPILKAGEEYNHTTIYKFSTRS